MLTKVFDLKYQRTKLNVCLSYSYSNLVFFRIKCLHFDEENEMLDVGLENGIIKKLDYLSGRIVD